jgi:carbon storage regulator
VVLVLSRRRNEKIVIADEITITVLEVRGDQVQLGIQAPRNIPVHRWEVFRAIHEGTPPEGSGPAGETPQE